MINEDILKSNESIFSTWILIKSTSISLSVVCPQQNDVLEINRFVFVRMTIKTNSVPSMRDDRSLKFFCTRDETKGSNILIDTRPRGFFYSYHLIDRSSEQRTKRRDLLRFIVTNFVGLQQRGKQSVIIDNIDRHAEFHLTVFLSFSFQFFLSDCLHRSNKIVRSPTLKQMAEPCSRSSSVSFCTPDTRLPIDFTRFTARSRRIENAYFKTSVELTVKLVNRKRRQTNRSGAQRVTYE